MICIGEGFLPEELKERNEKNKLDRKREKVFTRQAIMYFQKKTSKDSWATVGEYFGLDHATAMHAASHIQDLIDTDRKTAAKMTMYENKITALINFENNIILDKIEEIKETLKRKIENNDFISFELVAIYNNLTEKNKTNKIISE
jgi:hypothetical protein